MEECWKLGNVEIIELTPTNIIPLAQYFIPETHSNLSIFPINARLYRTSKGIKKVTAEIVDYEEAEKRVAGMNKTFESTKALVETVNGKEIVCQQVSYESYSAPKEDTKAQDIVTS